MDLCLHSPYTLATCITNSKPHVEVTSSETSVHFYQTTRRHIPKTSYSVRVYSCLAGYPRDSPLSTLGAHCRRCCRAITVRFCLTQTTSAVHLYPALSLSTAAKHAPKSTYLRSQFRWLPYVRTVEHADSTFSAQTASMHGTD